MNRAARHRESAALRLFVALALEGELRDAAVLALRALRARPGSDSVRWAREEGLHVTLRFLGATPREALPRLVESLGDAASRCAPFGLELGELQIFPSPRRARVISLGLAPEEPLAALAASFESAAVACGFAPEARSFRAHLTLGRLRTPGRCRVSLDGAQPPRTSMRVTRAVLFESELADGGSHYTALHHFPLGAVPGVRITPDAAGATRAAN